MPDATPALPSVEAFRNELLPALRELNETLRRNFSGDFFYRGGCADHSLRGLIGLADPQAQEIAYPHEDAYVSDKVRGLMQYFTDGPSDPSHLQPHQLVRRDFSAIKSLMEQVLDHDQPLISDRKESRRKAAADAIVLLEEIMPRLDLVEAFLRDNPKEIARRNQEATTADQERNKAASAEAIRAARARRAAKTERNIGS